MGKSSGAEAAHSGDSPGNQASTHSDGGAASASREIFQGLFKDLGKQAMAMESILRLVCGKVDKLEHWVTEMSFGMTELDLQLRNIAHNIEGTAANVDDVPSVSRWAVPQEQEAAPTATVVKKVGVGLHKKKQMRMTGMVANILDQLTAVADTPVATVESENESHKGDEKKKAKAKAKKSKASIVGSTSGVMSPLSASSAATTPRASEATEKAKPSKKKALKHADAKITEETPAAVTDVDAEVVNETPARSESAVAAEDLRSALEQHVETPVVGQDGVPTSPLDAVDEANHERDEGPLVELAEETKPTNQPSEEHTNTEDTPIVSTKDGEQATVDTPAHEKAEEPADQVSRDEETVLEQKQVSPIKPEELAAQTILKSAGAAEQHEADSASTMPTAAPLAINEEVNLPAPAKPKIEHSPDTETAALSPADASRTKIDHGSEKQIGEQDQPIEARPEMPANEIPDQPTMATTSATTPPDELTETPVAPTPDVPISAPEVEVKQMSVGDTPNTLLIEDQPNSRPVEPSVPSLQDAVSVDPSSPAIEPTAHPEEPVALLKKSPSKRLRRGNSGSTNDSAQSVSPTKKGSRRASIRKSITQRQTSIKRRQTHEQPLEEEAPREAANASTPPQADLEQTEKPVLSEIGSKKCHGTDHVESNEQQQRIETELTANGYADTTKTVDEDESEDGEDDDEDDDDSSPLGSGSDESVLDLDERLSSPTSSKTPATAAEKKMSMKMTRTLSALSKLKKAEVLTPEEIAELKQRANQKWFKLRDHVKEKNKKDVANILLKRKKNIFTVSNRIELLEEKSREVYASIKQLNTELKGKVESSTFEGLRRHVHDIHVSLQVLDDKISKGNTPAMDHIKQLAKDTEAMRLFFLEQLELARDHCDANHRETITLFDEQWQRVLEIEKNIRDKLTTLVAEYDDKLHDLPDYTDALEGIRRAIRKKADVKALRELEARLLGHDAEAEDCLVRCLSCHKEVVNTGHEISQPQDDADSSVAGSPHFKRVNPGASSARVYRSNVPFNAQPIGLPDTTTELLGQSTSEDLAPASGPLGSTSKALTPSRTRSSDPRPSPLSFIHVTATRAISANGDGSRPISAPVSALKKKPQPKTNAPH